MIKQRPRSWNPAEVIAKEIARQAEFGMEPSYEDMVEAGADAIQDAMISSALQQADEAVERLKALDKSEEE